MILKYQCNVLLRCGTVMEWCAVGCWHDGLRVADQRERNTLVPFTWEVSPQISAVLPSTRENWFRSINVDAARPLLVFVGNIIVLCTKQWLMCVVCCSSLFFFASCSFYIRRNPY